MRSLAFFMAVTMLAQAPQADVAKLLGSGRSDLWVFGVAQDPTTGSVAVELRSWKVPVTFWGATGAVASPIELLYSERPSDWDWANRPARQLHGDFKYHLSKYDDRSAFSADWGMGTHKDGTYFNEGAILRYEGGRLKLIANGLKQARLDYGLHEAQDFLGIVGNKVFYFDSTKGDRIFFFEKGHPDQRFEVVIPTRPWWPRSWKLASAEQVFMGEKPDEVLVYIWVKNTAWVSAKSRRDSMGVPVDLKTAKPVPSGVK